MSSGNTKALHTDIFRIDAPPQAIAEETDFWALWTQHQPFLLAICMGWVRGDEGEARELLSGAMMLALDHITKGNCQIVNPKAWLTRILRNHFIDLYRRQVRFPDQPIDLEVLIQPLDQERFIEELSPEKSMVKDEEYGQLKAAVEDLPDRLRSVLILRAYQDMPYKEIARHLNISPSNARKRIQQARGILRSTLKADPDVPGMRERSADSNDNSPRSERKAAEDELDRFPNTSLRMEPMAHPVMTQLDEYRSIELPIATFQRPIRIRQKLEAAETYIAKHPRGWKRRRERAMILALQGRIWEAGEEISRVLDRQPHLIEGLFVAARWMQWMDRAAEARELVEQGLTYVPDNAWRYLLEGRCLVMLGDHEEANRSFEQACLKSPLPVCQLLLAENLVAMGSWKKAAFHLERNSMRQGMLLYQACLSKLRHFNLRDRVIRSMRATFPGDPYILAIALENQYLKGRINNRAEPKTRQLLQELRRSAPKSSLILFGKVASLTYKDQPNRALTFMESELSTTVLSLQHLILGEKWFSRLGAEDQAKNLNALRKERFPNLEPWEGFLPYLPWTH